VREHDHVTADAVPMVGIVVVNYFGGEMTIECLESLERLTWPRERLAACLVDNGSDPGWAGSVRARFPWLRFVSAGANLGFAGACNLGIDALSDCEFVALLNNDAIPEPDWLEPLVDVLRTDEGLWAATPKVLFDRRYLPLQVHSQAAAPGGGDTRTLGVQLLGVKVDEEEVLDGLLLVKGFWGWEHDAASGSFAWTDGAAQALVPATRPRPDQLAIRVAALSPRLVEVAAGQATTTAQADASPIEVRLARPGPPVDVVNNVGTTLLGSGHVADRGYLEPDLGQYDASEEVWGWSGAAVLLRRRVLEELGRFEHRFFLYYEDADLSWRARNRGWRCRYVPTSVVRHRHSATTGKHPALVAHLAERNRLLTLTRNAPPRMTLAALGAMAWDLARAAWAVGVLRLAAGRRPITHHVIGRARVLVGDVRLVPSTGWSRTPASSDAGRGSSGRAGRIRAISSARRRVFSSKRLTSQLRCPETPIRNKVENRNSADGP
jgi:GT2 family glycosyltransferase